MQGSSVRGSVVAMGIGDEGYGGTREERVGRCKRTIKFYGSPELYLSPACALVCRLCADGALYATSSPDNILLFYLFNKE